MSNLELIVKNMLDAGESEENVSLVIKEYNKEPKEEKDPPKKKSWEPSVFTNEGIVDTEYYENLPLMDKDRGEYDKWKEQKNISDEATVDTKAFETRADIQKPSEIAKTLDDEKAINDQIAQQLKTIDLSKAKNEQELIDDISVIQQDVINNDKVLKPEINKLEENIKNEFEKGQSNILKQYDFDGLTQRIADKYDLTQASQVELANKELEAEREKMINSASKEIEALQEELEKYRDKKIKDLEGSELFTSRVSYLNKKLDEQASPILKRWKIDNLPGYDGTILRAVEGTFLEDLFAGTKEIGRSFQAAQISLQQLGIKDAQRQIDEVTLIPGLRDDREIVVYNNGDINYDQSNIPEPARISQASGTPRSGRFNLKGELITGPQSAFGGELKSSKMTVGEYKKMLRDKQDRFADNIKIQVEDIEDYNKVLELIDSPDFFDEDGITTKDLVGTVMRVIPQLGVGVGGAALAPATGGSSMVASTMFIFGNEYGNNYWEALETGLTKELGRPPTNEEIVDALAKNKYQGQGEAAGWAAVSSLLEQGTGIRGVKGLQKVNNSIKKLSEKAGFKSIKDMTIKTGKNNFTDMLKDGGKTLIQQGKGGIKEFFTEGTQSLASQAAVSQTLGNTAIDNIDAKQALQEAIGGSIVGFSLPGIGGMYRGGRNFIRQSAYKAAIGETASIKRDKFFKDASTALNDLYKNGKITREQYQQESQDIADLKNSSTKIPKTFSVEARQQALDLMLERKKLQNKIENEDEAFTKPDKDRIKEINSELLNIYNTQEEVRKTQVVKEGIEDQIITVAGAKGADIPTDSRVEFFNADNVNEISKRYNIPKENLIDEDGNFVNDGNYIQDQNVILISNEAAKGVLEHEGLHNYLDIALNDPNNKDVVFGMAEVIKDKMKAVDPKAFNVIEEQLKKYEADPNYSPQQVAEEVLTYYGQLKAAGFFKQADNRGIVTKIVDYIKELLESLGFKNIEINANNIDKVIDNYVDNIQKGKLTGKQKRIARGQVTVAEDLRQPDTQVQEEAVQEVVEEAPVRMAAAKPISVDTESMSTAFDQNITEDLTTNEDFKNSDAALDAFDNIENNSQFNNYINQLINRDNNLQGLDPEVKQEVNRKIKENLQLRTLNNFKPVVDGNRRSLFSYLYGKADQRGLGGIAQKALLDVKKEYATRADATARSIDQPTSEGRTFDIEDTSTDIIEEVDRGVAKQPKSTFRRNIARGKDKGLTQEEVKSFKEISEPIVDKLPPVDDAKYRTKVDQLAGKDLRNWVKNNILKGQDYKTFIADNYNNIRDLDLKYLIEIDKGLMKQGKPRMFTKKNRRLTTQADIRKYRDSGRAFVENEAQGVMLYDVLDPGVDAVVDFYTNQTPQNVSNRKGKLAEAFGKKMFKDFLPESRAKRGDTDRTKATSARKTQTRPDILFAKKGVNEALASLGLTPLKPRNSKGEVVNQKDIEEFKDFLINTFIKYLPVSLLSKTTLANGGRGKFPSQYFTSKEVDDIVIEARPNQEFDLTKEERDALNSVKTSVSTWWDKFKSTGQRVFQNAKWKETEAQKQKGLEILWKQFEKMYKADPKNAKYIAAYIETSSANSSHIMRMAGYPIGYEVNWKDTLSKRGPEREHVIPANQVGEFLFKVAIGRFGSKITIDKVMPFIKDNYFQILINKNNDHKLKAAGFQSAMPEGFFESIIEAIDKNDPNIAMKVWARYFNPEVNNQVGPDGQKGFNPNEIILEKGSLADIFGIGSNMLSKQEINNPNIVSIQQDLIYKMSTDPDFNIKDAQKELLVYIKKPKNTESLAAEQQKATIDTEKEIKESNVILASKKMDIEELLSKAASIDQALKFANSLNQPVKKIRIFDFDDTIATSKSIVSYTKTDGTKGQLTAEEFAVKGADLINEGAVMDFSDFNLVREGKRGPLFNVAKKIKAARGNEDLFILTARAPESQDAIYEFLKAEGLEFKKSNIVGLGNSTGEAKANWIIDKAAEGYNDFYFADDAYQNVKAVKDALSVIDVKSKVQQARVKESKKLSEEFNMLLEESTGVEAFKEYSASKAETIGASKGKFKFFIPYSAEDFLGLIYPTLAKGTKGDAQMAWYKQNLLNPYTKAQENLSAARLNLMNDFKQLKRSLDVPRDLRKKNESGFTNEQAVRVNLFSRMGFDMTQFGLSKRDLKELNDIVDKSPKLSTFADQILSITKGDGYTAPDKNWLVGTITTDLINLINTQKRSKYLAEWQERVDAIYTDSNLNKLEAIYGTKYRKALEGVLTRMKTGKNRVNSGSQIENRILDYINGSIGTVMFFNMRSAVLQTISSINFVNWSFNNPLKAGKAFANQPQYWKDFKTLINSDYLVDRRNGLKLNISESEIADAAATSKNKAKAALNYILQKGFLPTQYADSFAIASGGATFYRNRINDLVDKGMDTKQAEKQALIEWRQIAEESQQSSDPSRISAQQASNAGRIILAFANTPMQYARLQKRAIQDLVNGRGDAKSHISRIIYYGFVQNIIFNALQQAVNVFGYGDDDDDDPAKEKKYLNVANGMLDSLLRGLGIAGQAVSVGKNFLADLYERSGRKRPEYVDSVWKLTQFSPPINSKISRLKQAAWHFDSKKRREKIFEKGFALDNPAYEAFAKVISATTNFPLDRVLQKANNIEGALAEDTELWMRIAQLGGWPRWQLEDKKYEKPLTDEEKTKNKEDKKLSIYKAAKGSTDYDTLKKLTAAQQIKMLKSLGYGDYTIKNAKSEKAKIDLIIYKNSGGKIKVDKKAEDTAKYKALNKAEQVKKLDSLGLSAAEIKALKYEKDRVEKLLELMK